jgi:rod shape-determining protein MreC
VRFIYTKAFAIFFLSLVLATAIVFFHTQGWLNPFQRAVLQLPRPINYVVHKVVSPVKTFFSNAYRLREIVKDNAQLEQEVWELKNRQVLFDQYSYENEQLKKELQFSKSSKLVLEPCTIIGRNPTGIVDTITTNCGTSEGAEAGRAVTSRGFLVGKITYAAEGFSTVQLITNSNFSVDAKLSQSGKLAIAKGSFNSGLVLEQVSQDEPLEKGMLVVTAGVNDKVAKNLLVGEVGEILSGPNDLFKKASLISPVDFGSLEFIFLVK